MGKERAEAWRLYKEKSPEEALIFVRDIEARLALIRQNIMLRETPVPYKVWGKEYIDEGALQQMRDAAHLPVAV
ncbi:MAG TPA: RtcB family protein, partial [Rhabdochlamydiaceae bacterium]